MQPNDHQLVDLVRELPAAELAPEQIESLWQRFVDSAQLRDELLRAAPGADYLREAFGRLDLPVEPYLKDSPTEEGAGGSVPADRGLGSSPKTSDPPILVHMSWLPILPLVVFLLLSIVIGLIPVIRRGLGVPPAATGSQAGRVNSTEPSRADAARGDGTPPADENATDESAARRLRTRRVTFRRRPARRPIRPNQRPRISLLPRPKRTVPTTNRESRPPAPEASSDESDDPSVTDVAAAPSLVVSDDPSHPLAIELNKEGYNVWAELKASLDEQAYSDVLRTMRLTPHGAQLGLLPDPVDEDLFIPFRSLIAAATRDHPELLYEMREKFGPVAQVRLAAATAHCDVIGVESVAVQFYGTEAAAGAHRWLGDRALSGGGFRKAIQHYRRALAFGFAGLEADLNARLRLAGAMLGLDLGRTVAGPVALGDAQLSPSEFEAMVQQQRDRHADPAAGAPDLFPPPNEIPPAPAPAPYELRRWGSMPVGSRGWMKFDGDAWRFPSDFDWAAWCLPAAAAGRFVIVSNRLQIAGLDFVTGQRKWLQEFGDPRGYPQTWNWVPMRPLVVGDRIYTRRVPRMTGPELVCLDRQTGRVVWAVRPGDQVTSQPVWHRGSLVAVTASSTEPTFPAALSRVRPQAKDRVFQLHLTTFDPTNGEVLADAAWVHLRDHWYGALPCRATTAGDDLIVTVGGIVVSANLDGEIRWLRRQPYGTKKGEVPPHDRYHGPPILDEDRLFAYQPGAKAIECLDSETGRRIWQCKLPGIRRVVGMTAGHLIVNVDSHLTAVRGVDGTVTWQHEPEGLTQAYLCGGPGSLAYVDRRTLASGDWGLDLVWLDPQTGDVVGRHRLTEFSRRGRSAYIPQAGPFFQIADRLLLGISEQHPRPTDREFFELLPGS